MLANFTVTRLQNFTICLRLDIHKPLRSNSIPGHFSRCSWVSSGLFCTSELSCGLAELSCAIEGQNLQLRSFLWEFLKLKVKRIISGTSRTSKKHNLDYIWDLQDVKLRKWLPIHFADSTFMVTVATEIKISTCERNL